MPIKTQFHKYNFRSLVYLSILALGEKSKKYTKNQLAVLIYELEKLKIRGLGYLLTADQLLKKDAVVDDSQLALKLMLTEESEIKGYLKIVNKVQSLIAQSNSLLSPTNTQIIRDQIIEEEKKITKIMFDHLENYGNLPLAFEEVYPGVTEAYNALKARMETMHQKREELLIAYQHQKIEINKRLKSTRANKQEKALLAQIERTMDTLMDWYDELPRIDPSNLYITIPRVSLEKEHANIQSYVKFVDQIQLGFFSRLIDWLHELWFSIVDIMLKKKKSLNKSTIAANLSTFGLMTKFKDEYNRISLADLVYTQASNLFQSKNYDDCITQINACIATYQQLGMMNDCKMAACYETLSLCYLEKAKYSDNEKQEFLELSHSFNEKARTIYNKQLSENKALIPDLEGRIQEHEIITQEVTEEQPAGFLRDFLLKVKRVYNDEEISDYKKQLEVSRHLMPSLTQKKEGLINNQKEIEQLKAYNPGITLS